MKVKIVCMLLHYVVASNILVKISSYLSSFSQDFFHLRIHLLLVHFVHDDDLRLYWAKISEIKQFNLWPNRSTWDLRHWWTLFCEFSNKSDFDWHSSLVSTRDTSSFDFPGDAKRDFSTHFSAPTYLHNLIKPPGSVHYRTKGPRILLDLASTNVLARFVLFSKFCLHPGAQYSTRSSVEIAQFTEQACLIK